MPRTQPKQTEENRGRPRFFSLSFRFDRLWVSIIWIACLPTLLSLGARFWWVLELATHFSWQYAVVLPALLVAAVALRKKRLAALVAFCLLVNIHRVAPLYLSAGAPPDGESTKSLRVMTLNVLTTNSQHERVLATIVREDPDVVLLFEVDQAWVDAMKPLEDRYPVRLYRPRSDNFGLSFFTRLEADEVATIDFNAEVPSVVAKLRWNESEITFVGTHPLPPISAGYSALRDSQLVYVSEFVLKQPRPIVVMGDLNLTRFSPAFGDFAGNSKLVDSARGFGFQPTWTTRFDFLGVPIDHVLHSPDLVALDRRVGPPVGSDHLPVVVDLAKSQADSP